MTQFVLDVFPRKNRKKCKRFIFSSKKKIVVGRSYSCDLILEDPCVSREHISISVEDGFEITDLNSKNGTKFEKKHIRDDVFDIKTGDEIQIGHTLIRFLAHDHVLHPTKKINWANHLRSFFTYPIIAILLFMISLLSSGLYELMLTTQHDYLDVQIYKDMMMSGGFIVLVAFTLFAFTATSKHTIKFFPALSYTSVCAIFIMAFNLALDLLLQPIYANSLSHIKTLGIYTFLFSLSVLLSILFIAYLEEGKILKRVWVISALIISCIISLMFYEHVLPSDHDRLLPKFETSISVYAWEPKEAMSIEEFFMHTDTSFADP
jgi:pSer/pThr/pTyr-binding forkhead associated (FHA) protein